MPRPRDGTSLLLPFDRMELGGLTADMAQEMQQRREIFRERFAAQLQTSNVQARGVTAAGASKQRGAQMLRITSPPRSPLRSARGPREE